MYVCKKFRISGFSLISLQGAVIKQDSILELLLQETMVPAAGGVWRPLWRDGGNREASVGSTIGELALLQRQHSLLQEELLRLRDAESRFKDSERARAKLERQVRHMKVCSGATPGELSSQVRKNCILISQSPQGAHRRTIDTSFISRFTTDYFCIYCCRSLHLCNQEGSSQVELTGVRNLSTNHMVYRLAVMWRWT